jgi:hypothetical protein
MALFPLSFELLRATTPHISPSTKYIINMATRPVPLWKDPDFPFSLDLRNVETLETRYLPWVKDGIVHAATRYKFTLRDSTLQWLKRHHDGHYENYLEPRSTEGKSKLTTLLYLQMDADERKARYLLKHTHVGESPRFNGAALKANTKLNYEKQLLKFWYFLAMIGDYKSMFILLVEPLIGTPSVSVASLKSFCDHRYLAPWTPLTVPGKASPLLDIHGCTVLAEGTTKKL